MKLASLAFTAGGVLTVILSVTVIGYWLFAVFAVPSFAAAGILWKVR